MNIKNKINSNYIYFAVIASNCSYSLYYETDNIIFRVISFLAVLIFYYNSFSILKKWSVVARGDSESKLLYFNLLLTILLVAISVNLKVEDIITLFTHPYSFLAFYIAIVSLTVEKDTIFKINRICRFANNIFLLIILFDFYFFKKPLLINDLGYFLIWELVLFDKLKFWRKIYIYSLIIFMIVVSNSYDNRTIFIRFIGVISLLVVFKYLSFLQNKFLKLMFLTVSMVSLYFITFHFKDTFNLITGLITNKTIDTTDTRTFIFIEFFQSFKNWDWLAGKGYLGTYYSQYFYDWEGLGGDSSTRFSVEIGIMHILLKGGLTLLIPFMYIFIKALRIGFVKNNLSSVSFRLAIFLLVDFVLLGIENFPAFQIHYMFIWLAIGIIFKEQFFKKNIFLHNKFNNLKNESVEVT